MRRILLDKTLEETFQRDGYVSIPFLNRDEVEELKKYYFDTLNESGGHLGPEDESFQTKTEITYDFTFIDKNIGYKRQVFEKISKMFKDKYNDYLDNYTPIIANFIYKKPNGGEVPMHQNWAFVDEHKCTSVSIWCPLIDSNAENGTLQVVPGSHKRYGEIRGPMIRSELLDIENEIISKHMVPLITKAGNAVVLDDSLVHYSAPNRTDGLRLTIQLILIPKEEVSIHYHMDLGKDKNTVETLEVDHNFYMQFNPWKKPSDDLKRLNRIKYTPFSLTLEQFEKRLKGPKFDEAQKSSSSIWKFFKRKKEVI